MARDGLYICQVPIAFSIHSIYISVLVSILHPQDCPISSPGLQLFCLFHQLCPPTSVLSTHLEHQHLHRTLGFPFVEPLILSLSKTSLKMVAFFYFLALIAPSAFCIPVAGIFSIGTGHVDMKRQSSIFSCTGHYHSPVCAGRPDKTSTSLLEEKRGRGSHCESERYAHSSLLELPMLTDCV